MRTRSGNFRRRCLPLVVVLLSTGCGTTVKNGAIEQLLASDAVDRSVAQIDFRDLCGEKVYFDNQYIKSIKGIGFVNADYITSALRQQLVAANCLLQEKPEDADYIVEARVGAVGTDGHEVTYGLSSNNAINTAASLVAPVPPLPPFPEISFAKKNHQTGAAKIAVFAYNRTTKQPVWQSGSITATSTAKDTWILGAGPFQRGTIYDGTQFAGTKLDLPFFGGKHNDKHSDGKRNAPQHSLVDYEEEFHFQEPSAAEPEPEHEKTEPRLLPEEVRHWTLPRVKESTDATK